MRQKIALTEGTIDLDDVQWLIHKLFSNREVGEVTITVLEDSIKVAITDIYGTNLSKPIVYPNIKDRSTLGFYSSAHDLTMLPVNGGMFIIKNGVGTNNPIRPLFPD